ncbi:protein trichome birefringence-like 34 [Salvia splendens]|uniref:protein trichome birefringence-like 34 n=1 Tax=Salvia splendens TaxID=180675 RepID=UPI001C25FF32|nr:protein trichome birefringence-like 34 [Salvia splendens]
MGILSHCILGFSLLILACAVFYLSKNEVPTSYENISSSSCNLFEGGWVFDNISLPFYEEQCSFMLGEFACETFGRKDLKYQNWRWQPHQCDLPRFNGTAFLEKIRGKKLVFVGDSLNRNQWTSMLCLIESSLGPLSPTTVVRNENMRSFHSIEYNATIGLYWSPFMVESNCDDPLIHRVKTRVIRLMGIDKHARHWNDADILVFNSYLWWTDPMTIVWGTSFASSDAINKTVDGMSTRLYEMVLDIWSDWLEININRTKTKMFFMSPSPFHLYGKKWDELRNCYKETEPILDEGSIGLSILGFKMRVAELALEKLRTRGINIEYLNITHLSEFRGDAHPSIHKYFFHTISEEELANPTSYSDCSHWCLPGVPDVWNQILYSYIMNI